MTTTPTNQVAADFTTTILGSFQLLVHQNSHLSNTCPRPSLALQSVLLTFVFTAVASLNIFDYSHKKVYSCNNILAFCYNFVYSSIFHLTQYRCITLFSTWVLS